MWIHRDALQNYLQVKTTCRSDQCGIEIQVPSTSGDGSASWMIISRGSNRYVELQCNDPDFSPESHELANHTSVGKTARDIVKHRGNSCDTAENTIESDEQPFRRFYPKLTKGSGLTFLPMMMPKERLWSGRSRNWL